MHTVPPDSFEGLSEEELQSWRRLRELGYISYAFIPGDIPWIYEFGRVVRELLAKYEKS